MLKNRPANDHRTAVPKRGEAELLLEIETLRAALDGCAARIAELDRLANVDPLVELPNRRNFLNRLDSAIADVRRHEVDGAIVFLDVDGLKSINDKFGHGAGDRALMEVASLLVSSVRTGDVVARLSGDEFAILLERTDELTAWLIAERVVETIDNSRFCVAGVFIQLSVAVGVAMLANDDTPHAALSRADREMYRIKALSGGASPR